MSERLEPRIERCLRTGEGEFEPLALELFSQQYARNIAYQSFCSAQNLTPANVSRWQDIPAVPIGAFKSAQLATFPVGQAAAVFHSSGTTENHPSRHFLKTLTYYEVSLAAGFQRWVMPSGGPKTLLILAPSPGEAPHSSLSWMLDVVKRRWGAADSDYFIRRGWVEERRLFKILDAKQQAGEPVLCLGTTLAFLKFFDQCENQARRFVCAAGTRLMDTGGMKTETRLTTRDEFLHKVGNCLAIPERECINEYGMCELGSQFYALGASAFFQGPAWVRTRVIDPLTGQDAAPGQPGLLVHYDLANVDSVMAIQTEDEGIAQDGGFIFRGRAAGAAPKGCSLQLERNLA
jgi:hypothetical protein